MNVVNVPLGWATGWAITSLHMLVGCCFERDWCSNHIEFVPGEKHRRLKISKSA